MATLLDRLKTFDNGWCVPFLRPIEMAKAGFSFLGLQDQVKCFFCSTVFESWQQDDDPLAEHRLHSPECPFICAIKSDHIQVITLEDRLRSFVDKWSLEFLKPIEMAKAGFTYLGIQDRVKCFSCWNDFDNWQQGDDPLAKHIFQSPQCPFVLEPTNDLQKTMLKDRLKTFDDGWSVQFLRPVEMAKAGFIYLGIQDHVKCFSCSKNIDNWQQGDDPLVKHIYQSPQCPFVLEPKRNGFECKLHFFSECPKTLLSKHKVNFIHQGIRKFVYDVCGPYGSEPSGAYIEAKNIQDCLDSVGIIQKLEALIHPEFASFNARLKSFDKCFITLIQDINTLCEAGFFYKGNGTDDKMRCFYCSLVLHNWDNDDDPWTEHARYSRNCSYLILKTGKFFVDKVHGVDGDITKSNLMKLVKLIAKHGDTYIVGSSMKIRSTKKILDLLQNTGLSVIKISSFENQHISLTRNLNKIPDFMLCKICFKEEIMVAFVSCGHTIACIQCALTIVQCAICKHPFNKAMRIYLSPGKDPKDSSTKCPDNKLDSMLCNVCFKEDMVAVFIPCRHVYACVKCAEEIDECPVCKENVCSFIQLHI